MDIWLVIDRYDHSESVTTAHLTLKGALIKAYEVLIETFDNCADFYDSDDDHVNEFQEEYPDAFEFIKQHRSNIPEAKTADLDKHISDLCQWVGEHTDWSTDVTVQATRLQA